MAKKLYLEASRISKNEDFVVEDVYDLLWVSALIIYKNNFF